MNRNNAKSLSTLRQKLRKYNREFEEEISKFRENPDMADEDEQEENDDDLDEGVLSRHTTCRQAKFVSSTWRFNSI